MLAFWDFARFSVHGDTEAVFEYDTPQIVLDEMEEADDGTASLGHDSVDVTGKGRGRPKLKRAKTRKDSFGPIGGLNEHLAELFHEHGAGDIPGRLESLEIATNRIEVMLNKISQTLGNDNSDSETKVPREHRDVGDA